RNPEHAGVGDAHQCAQPRLRHFRRRAQAGTHAAHQGVLHLLASPMSLLDRYPSVPYVAPFAVFLALLSGLPMVGLPPREQSVVRAGTLLLVIGLVARPFLRLDFIR